MGTMKAELEKLFDDILNGDMTTTPDSVQAALDAGVAPDVILNTGMIPAMTEAGRLFEVGDYFVPEMLIAARAMQAGLGILQPHLAATGVEPVGKVVIGTVQGDLHDIGKNLVAMMLEGAGFKVIDMGVDVPADRFAEAIREHAPQVVALSALLTTTMPQMGKTIAALREAGLLENTKVLIGGAPVTAAYAESIGADGYAADASKAATLAKSYLVTA
jgi:5-methyltetrahydrofolate--homocysteine methyltransferase